MINNKKGLSAIIGTLLIILLVIVAVGIIWVVIRGTLESGVEDLEAGAKCLDSSVKVTAALCDGSTCNITVQRQSGSDEIDGIRVIASDGSQSNSTDSGVNLQSLGIATYEVGISGYGDITSVQAALYFNDADGNPGICSGADEFTSGINNTA